MAHDETATQLHPPRKDASLNNLQRQGHGTEPSWPTHAYDLQLHKQLVIQMEETNPEQDIQAPNRYTIQVCQRMRAAAVAPETVAQVYRPDGSFVAGLTLDRLTYLKAAYDSCSGLPALADLRPGTFEEELARLLLHNSPRALKRDSTAQQASAPATLLQVLRTGLGVTKERNVSPLAVHFDTEAFWSSNTRDQLFGASHQAGGHQVDRGLACEPTTLGNRNG